MSVRLARLATNVPAAARMIVSYNSGGLRKRLGRPGVLPVTASVDFLGQSVDVSFRRVADYHVLSEVLGDREYEWALPWEPKIVLDLGANCGISTLYLWRSHAGAEIHAVEPDGGSFECLRDNVGGLSRVRLHNLAVAGSTGTMRFFSSGGKAISSSLVRRDSQQRETIVHAVTLDALIHRIGASAVDLVKFDIEGAEFEVFRNCESRASIPFLIGELHPDLAGMDVRVFLDLFPDHVATLRSLPCGRPIVRLVHRARARGAKRSGQ